ncbi:hypothetical protein FXN61_19410 [Lentzea sp. PSKA42]|uniref:SD-repeat containing protein B domain-containing protein n=1 Tax=Lentzea indica TaxID=2604800 RepID=A0ABX1FJ65_9PSEU|nr:carboxypeptidase-like regulatory domain-containing protein [Lentzea indica]NKE58857.1 hypothetical protein [Lentzea indica]
MSKRSVSAALRSGALTTVAVLAFSTTSAAAFAQDDPTTTTPPAPTETSAPPVSEPPPAPSPARQDSVTGVLYADKNRNVRQDAGEAISGGAVTVVGNSSEFKTTSDADGKFAFRDLAPGTYRLSYVLADGWVVHHAKAEGDLITVVANQTAEVAARAERPYSEQLKATATLDHPKYHQPSTATIALSLTNTTDRPISGIQAACGRDGSAHALGRGEGWNVLKGVKLEAGETRKFTIYEQIPLAARGSVKLDCDFAPNASWNTDGPSVHGEAAVSGASNGYTMVLGQDRNADGHIDADEDIAVEGYSLLNPRTGEKIVRRNANPGGDGKIELTDVPSGDYRIELLGPWTFRDFGQDLVRITEQGGFRYGFLKPTGPAKVTGTVKFEKPRYESHETVRLDLTITNVGGQVVEDVRLSSEPYALNIPAEQWGDFGPRGRGITLTAGESRTFSVSGTIRSFGNSLLGFWGGIDYRSSDGWHFGYHDFGGTVEVVLTTGDLTGVVYVDRNRDGRQDAGEAAANAVVEANGGAPYGYFKTTTDSDGRFSFKDIPTGGYWVSYTLPDGWIVHLEGELQQTRVEPGVATQVVARAERPYRERLKATVVLDKATYALGDEAQVTITLKNTDDRRISGIQVRCNPLGHGNHLGGSGYYPAPPSWGDLRPTSKGVTLDAGETKVFVVKEPVPIAARSSRKLIVTCDFAPNPDRNTDGAHAYDWASIKGGGLTLKGWIGQDRNGSNWFDEGEGIPNTRIVLLTDRENGFPVVEAVSDAKGNVRFDDVPPGDYWAWIDGPWKFEGERGHTSVQDNNLHHPYFFSVVPDLSRTSGPGSTDGAANGGSSGALAKTGASVLGLGVLAVLLVAFGLGARVAGRRKTF